MVVMGLCPGAREYSSQRVVAHLQTLPLIGFRLPWRQNAWLWSNDLEFLSDSESRTVIREILIIHQDKSINQSCWGFIVVVPKIKILTCLDLHLVEVIRL